MKSETKVKIARLWNYPSEIGDRYGISWLTYNPGVFFEFAMVAKRNAPFFTNALIRCFPDARSFNDIGAGTGQFVKELRERGANISCAGYEYSGTARFFSFLNGVKLYSFDLSRSLPIHNLQMADIAYSLEVGEHIPSSLSSKFVKTLTDAGRVVIFTAAKPFQRGHGHINCQPKEFWEELFIKERYIKSSALEVKMIAELKKYPRISSFLINNLQVFIRKD